MSGAMLSDWLGWLSIGSWLGAQIPQVLENHRRQSVEGLALPFLANWLFGDITNLIGCVLTHQLPFQTYLASYFVSVDALLLVQYFYYTVPKPAGARLAERTASASHEREASHYRTLSVVAAHVAASAARAAQHEAARSRSRRATVDDEPSEDVLAALAESTASDQTARAPRKQHVSWSRERGMSQLSPIAPPEPEPRGRSRSRDADDAALRRSSRASRRGATLVFLGAWALFGVGTLAGVRRGLPLPARSPASTAVGRVLGTPVPVVHNVTTAPQAVWVPSIMAAAVEAEVPSTERVIGRVFAWTCTTLYLTSRLPQIWKNFVRKSVEGLSIALFVCAFLGNTFYVGSILTSPSMHGSPEAALAFLKESLPYLIGSGGTLMFDVTIVSQSILYRKRPALRPRGRRATASRTLDEEEAGLLEDDAGS